MGLSMPPIQLKHKVSLRYGATLLTNAMRVCIAAITGVIAARLMGPAEYGNVNFLLVSLSAALSIPEFGTTNAFYTFISSKKRGPVFYGVFLSFTFTRYFLVSLAVCVMPAWLLSKIWRGMPLGLLLVGGCASFAMYHLWTIIQQIGEAARETLFVQKLRLFVVVCNCMLVAGFGFLGYLNIYTFLLIIAVVHFSASILFACVFNWREHLDYKLEEKTSSVTKEFAVYCAPLAIVTLVTLFCSFLNRWILQNFSGSAQQGYFSIGDQLCTAILIFANSLSSIFWKEIASAYSIGDNDRTRVLFFKARSTLYFATATLACFVAAYSDEIVVNILGPRYTTMPLTLAPMVVVPIFGCWCQLNSSYMYATRRTKTEMLFTSLFAISNTAVAYFAIATPSARFPGLGLGAMGLALATILCCILVANVETLYIYRINRWKSDLSFQIRYPLVLFGLAYITKLATSFMPHSHIGFAMHLAIGGILYLLCAAGYAYLKQLELGVDMDKMRTFVSDIKKLTADNKN